MKLFITHTNNPTADRNKGRVSIGDINFCFLLY